MQSQTNQRRGKFLRLRIWQPHAEPFLHLISNWRFLVVLAVLLVFTDWLGRRWLFQAGSLAGMDVLWRAPKRLRANYCRLVTVDAEEFRTYLGEPFDPKKLESVLDTIGKYDPAVIVVDIDTSPARFASMALPKRHSRIVWARVSHENLRSVPGERRRTPYWMGGSVLGGRCPQPEHVGFPLFPQDADNIVRTFQRVVPVDTIAPALYWETLRAYSDCHATKGDGAEKSCRIVEANNADEELKLRTFHRDWDLIRYPLSDLMEPGGKEGPQPGQLRPQPGQLGDIVVLGGSFDDIHATLFGPRLGIELTAAAIETELSGPEPWQVPRWLHWVLKCLLAAAITWLNTRLMPLWAAPGTLLLLGLVFVASFVGIYYQFFQMDFLPFMIGIWIEQLVESSERAHHHMAH